jgi:hypothetical protein
MRIDPSLHPWMTAPETAQVFAALGEARFVGGPRRAKWPIIAAGGFGAMVPAILRDKKKKRRRHAH